MPRLSATPGLLGAAIAAAIALWWLPGAWLQAAGGFADVPQLSARAAFYLVLGQGVLVWLFAPRWFGERDRPGAVGARHAGDLTTGSPAWRAPTGLDSSAAAESPTSSPAQIGGIADLDARSAPEGRGPGWPESMRAPTAPGRMAVCAVSALSAVAPAWPLLALLWLTGALSALVLVASQLLIAFSAVLLALLGGALAHSSLSSPACDVLRGAAGLVPAAIAWSLRADLQAWMIPV